MLDCLRKKSWSWILKNFLLPIGDITLGQNLASRLKYLEKVQWWNYDEISKIQNENLQRLISVAYSEVELYKDLMDQTSLKPVDFVTSADLAKFPVISKDLLRVNYPESTTRFTNQRTYEARTSGSTGKNFVVLEDAETASYYRATLLLVLQWAGWYLGEPHIQTGMTTNRNIERRLKDLLLRCYYVSAYDLSNPSLDNILDLMEKYKIQHLWGYPGSIYYLAERASQKGWNKSIKSIVTWGDNLFDRYREKIEDVFKTTVFDTYGIAEGVQIAAQCEYGNYHLHCLDMVLEILDEDGNPSPNGELGEIVITRLHPGPMPLIRYKVGDLGVQSGLKFCPCGRGFNLLDSVAGRDTDVVITPTGNRLIVHFFTGIIEHFHEVDTFQVIQYTPNSIVIRIVPTKEFSHLLPQKLSARLKEKGASDLDINIELVNDIPLPESGKRRFVISHIAE